MELVLPVPPEDGLALVEDNLIPPAKVRTFILRAEAAVGEEEALALSVYTTPAEAFVDGRIVTSARLTAWVYAVSTDSMPAIAEISTRGFEPILAYASLRPLPDFSETIEALGGFARMNLHVPGTYEVRTLRSPGVYLWAAWLHLVEGPGVPDIFIPIPPVPSPLEVIAYSEQNLRDELRGLASFRLTTPDA